MRDKCVKLVQTSRYHWHLESPKGTIMVDNLSFDSIWKAEDWVKAYVSSYNDWSYVIKPKEQK